MIGGLIFGNVLLKLRRVIYALRHFQIFKFSNFPILFLSSFLPIVFQAQSLLLNGGFEEENSCTEYNVECAPEAWMSNANGFNNYFEDANRAYAGMRCMAIEVGHSSKPYHRTFIRSRLLCGLRNGHSYRIEFYIKSPHDVLDSMGVIFTPHDFMYESRKLHHLEPTFFVQPAEGEFRKDSNWQRVVVDFTANGTESFIAIANFSKRDITGNTGISMVKNFFVFVDDVSLQPLDKNELLCDGWQKSKKDIYDQNERHHYLQRLIKMHRNNPPVVKVPATTFVRIDTLSLPDMLFDLGKASLKPGSGIFLDSLCGSLKGKSIDSVVINGHTDNTGTAEINQRLSFDRAQTVAQAMNSRLKVREEVFIIRGFADSLPVADNSAPEGRTANRRVEILLYIRE